MEVKYWAIMECVLAGGDDNSAQRFKRLLGVLDVRTGLLKRKDYQLKTWGLYSSDWTSHRRPYLSLVSLQKSLPCLPWMEAAADCHLPRVLCCFHLGLSDLPCSDQSMGLSSVSQVRTEAKSSFLFKINSQLLLLFDLFFFNLNFTDVHMHIQCLCTLLHVLSQLIAEESEHALCDSRQWTPGDLHLVSSELCPRCLLPLLILLCAYHCNKS